MVELIQGETVLRTGSVGWAGRPGVGPGTLTLTNRAIIYEGPAPVGPPAAGGGPPQFAPGVRRIALWRCRLARSSPGPQGGPRLELDLLQRSLFFRTPEAQAWADAINNARASAPPPPPGMSAGAGPGAGSGADIAARRAAMPRCDYCGGLNAPMATKCKNCGAPLG
ncbi:MAG: hypothetical protein L3K18_04845 [Thermoplasmata archaeon]|nr:hypothetical protein [Thermoplasmata archaeon]